MNGKLIFPVGMCMVFFAPVFADDQHMMTSVIVIALLLVIGLPLMLIGEARIKVEEERQKQARSPSAVQEAMRRKFSGE